MTTSSAIVDRNQTASRVSAIIAAGLLVAFAALQVALATGAPWGGLVWGAADEGQLANELRVASGVAAVVLGWMALVLLTRGGVVPQTRIVPSRYLKVETWAIAGVMALNTLGNLASGNPFEQLVAAPVTATVAASAVFLALRGVDPSC